MARERAIANQLAKLLGAATSPVYAVDNRRRIVYCNAACAKWVGIAADQLVGQRCDYHPGDTGELRVDVAAKLCPPPEAFAGTSPSGIVSSQQTDHTVSERAACFFPLGGEDEQIGVFAILSTAESKDASLAEGDAGERESAALHRRLQEFTRELRTPFRLGRLVGDSLAMQRVREQIQIAIQARSHVQIVGAPGSGREHVARTIHCAADPMAAGPLMPLSCQLLDGELLQATVVAFLNRAKDDDPAHPATLLLLDADCLNEEAQAELLAYFRIPTFNLRTIATTQVPLLALAERDGFLTELASRLGGFVMKLPSLADRREDIPLLCQRFLEDYNAAGGKQFSGFAPSTLDQLCSLPWPGNVDELAEVVREICEQSEGPQIVDADVSRRVRLITSAMAHPKVEDETIQLDEFLLDVERELVQRALKQAKGNKAQAARLLGISRPRLLRRVTQLGLE
jgi:DNA-binding NtrC family response regulator